MLFRSSDGKVVLSGSADKTVRLFDLAAGNIVRQLASDNVAVTSVAFSADNTLAAAGNETGMISFRNVADGADRLHVAGHTGAVSAVAFHPKEKQIASAGIDGTIRLWALPVPPRALAGHAMPVQAADVSRDGKLIATASLDKTVKLWNVADATLAATLTGHAGAVGSVAFRHDDKQLASADATGVIRLWNIVDKSLQHTFGAHGAPITRLAYHPANELLLSGSGDGVVKLWDLTAAPPQALAGHTGKVDAVAFTSNELGRAHV